MAFWIESVGSKRKPKKLVPEVDDSKAGNRLVAHVILKFDDAIDTWMFPSSPTGLSKSLKSIFTIILNSKYFRQSSGY